MPDTLDNRTPKEWLEFLEPLLEAQARDTAIYRNYYAGNHAIANATARFKEIFGRYFPSAADNWCQIVVDSSVERLGIQGFRFGGLDQPADEDAQRIWQQNKLDSGSRIVHTEAVKCGRCALLVDPNEGGEFARITGEHPSQVYVYREPGSRFNRLAAIKKWIGDDKFGYANLYLPEAVYKFKSQAVIGKGGKSKVASYNQIDEVVNPYNVVSMIPVENAPDMIYGGTSDLDVVIPIQDRVNKLCLDLDVGSEFHAAPQRWAAGWEPPTDEDDKPLPTTQLEAATSRFLAFASPDTKVGSLPPGDPGSYVEPIEMYIQHIAAISRTPPHYLLGKMANLSGDALKAAETGLVCKVTAKQDDFADAWEEAIGLATGKDSTEAEVIWQDPESRTFSQQVDAVIKLRESLALPLEMGWEMIGMTPAKISRAKKLLGLPDRGPLEIDEAKVQTVDPNDENDPQDLNTNTNPGGAMPSGNGRTGRDA